MATRKPDGKQTDSIGTPLEPAKVKALKARLRQLEGEAKLFASLVEQARGEGNPEAAQLGPAVQAAAQYAATTKAIADIQAALLAEEMSEEERLTFLASRASADGSWVAASKLSSLVSDLRTKAQAAVANDSARVAALAADATDSTFLRGALQELMTMQATSTGIAKVQALKAAAKIREQLSLALKAEAGTGPMSDEEVKEAIRDQAPDIPDEHLVLYVQEWCARHNLPMPVRAVAGGRQ